MIKEYLKSEYNLRDLTEESSNYDRIILEKKYGRVINVYEWIDNLSIDCDLDGGIDYIVIDLDGKIIPLFEENELFEKMEELLFEEGEQDGIETRFNELGIDEQIKYVLKKLEKKHQKIKVDFYQMKSGNSFQERVLEKIKTTIGDIIINEKYDSIRYSKKLVYNIKFIKELIKNVSINDGAVEVNFFYLANCDAKPKSMNSFEELAVNIKDDMIRGLNHNHVNFSLLYGKEMVKFLEKFDDIDLRMKILKKDMLYKNNLYCIGLVKLEDLISFVTYNEEINLSLFDGNVRDSYKSSSSINKDIIETLEKEIETNDFWWLNNGITIICRSMKKIGNILHINEPQIVNGLQSVVAIYDTFKNGKTLNAKKKIMVRILVENNSSNIDTIIKTTNTQNPVDDYLLSSTKPIHREIEKSFLSFGDGYYYDRRKNYYKNLKKDKNKIFDIKYTFKTYSSIFLGIPSQVRTATKKNFKIYNEQVFDSNINVLSYLYSDLLDRKIQKVLKKTELDNNFKEKNGVSIVTYSLHLSYIYTALLKETLDFNDKYISSNDIHQIEALQIENKHLIKSIEILESILERYPSENKVYLARNTNFENDIKSEILKRINEGVK